MGLYDAVFVAFCNGLRQEAVRGYSVGIRRRVDALVQAAGQTEAGLGQCQRGAPGRSNDFAALRFGSEIERAPAHAGA